MCWLPLLCLLAPVRVSSFPLLVLSTGSVVFVAVHVRPRRSMPGVPWPFPCMGVPGADASRIQDAKSVHLGVRPVGGMDLNLQGGSAHRKHRAT